MTRVMDDKGIHCVVLIHEDDILYMKNVLEWASEHYLDNLKTKEEDYTRFDQRRKGIISKYVKQLEEDDNEQRTFPDAWTLSKAQPQRRKR